jgi:hypothetical protein
MRRPRVVMTSNEIDKYAWLIRAIAAPIREALAKRDAHLAQLEARIQDAERRLRDMETKSTVKRFTA